MVQCYNVNKKIVWQKFSKQSPGNKLVQRCVQELNRKLHAAERVAGEKEEEAEIARDRLEASEQLLEKVAEEARNTELELDV
jgi:hypothetical protein